MNAGRPDKSWRSVEGVGSLTLVHGAGSSSIGQVILERSLRTNDHKEVSGTSEVLRRRSIGLMIVLTLLTCGLYYPIWFLRARRSLNNLHASGKVGLTECVGLLVLQLTTVGSDILQIFGDAEQVRAVQPVVTVLIIAYGFMWWVLIFRVRHMLVEHLVRETHESFPLSRILTFGLSIFYFQHVINKRLIAADPVHLRVAMCP